MIVKSIGQRGKDVFGRLLEYITRPDAIIKDAKGQPILLHHNIQGSNLKALEQSFLTNEATRAYVSKNRLFAYHDILAFAKTDKEQLNISILEDLTREYLRQRAETGMAVATFHDDKEHYHVHVLIGSTEIATGKALRLTRGEFATVKEQVQVYQQEHYPQLSSVVEHGKGNEYISTDEYRMKERTGKSRKEEIKGILNAAFEQSYSQKQFYANAKEAGLEFYERNGVMGVADNRNYRMPTLGYDEKKMEELDKREERLAQLEGISNEDLQRVQIVDKILDINTIKINEIREDETPQEKLE